VRRELNQMDLDSLEGELGWRSLLEDLQAQRNALVDLLVNHEWVDQAGLLERAKTQGHLAQIKLVIEWPDQMRERLKEKKAKEA
jgi:hypothetical protein